MSTAPGLRAPRSRVARRLRESALRVTRGCRGCTLIEVLLAASLGAGLLAGAWAWAWTVAGSAARTGDAAEARTSLAFARRVLLADLRAAGGLDELGTCSDVAIALRVSPERHPEGVVSVVWSRERGVLWRLTPSCHLAGGVEAFAVRYLDAEGLTVGGGLEALTPTQKRTVAGVVVTLRLRYGLAYATGCWPVWFRGGGS